MPPCTRKKKAAIVKFPRPTKPKVEPPSEHLPNPIPNNEATKKPQPRSTRSSKCKAPETRDETTEDTIYVDHPASAGLDKDEEQEAVDLQLRQETGMDGNKESAITQRLKGLGNHARGQDIMNSVVGQKHVNEGQLRQYEDYLQQLRAKNLISSEQMEEMGMAARVRMGIPLKNADTVYDNSITPLHVEQYNAYLADLERRGLISNTQAEQLKQIGLETSCVKAAAQKGAFEERPRSSAEINVRNRFLQEYLEDLVARNLVTRQQTKYMKLIGIGSPKGNSASAEWETPKGNNTNTSMNIPKNVVPQQEFTSQIKTATSNSQVLPNTILQTLPDQIKPSQAAAAPISANAIPEQWTEGQKTNREIYNEIERLQIFQFEAFVDELSARGCIALDQRDPLKSFAFRGTRIRTASQKGVFVKPKKLNPSAEIYFKEFLSELRAGTMLTPTQCRDLEMEGLYEFWKKPNIRESSSIGQARHSMRLKRQDQIDLLDCRVYEQFLTHLKTKGILSVIQTEKLKSHGFIPFAKHASWQGCFKGVVEEINPYVEKVYERLLENYAQRGLLDGTMVAKLKEIGLRSLEMECSSPTMTSTLVPSLASRADDMQQSTRAEIMERVSNSFSRPLPPIPAQRDPSCQSKQQSGPSRRSRSKHRQPDIPLTNRLMHIQPDYRTAQNSKQVDVRNPDMGQVPNTGNVKEAAEIIVSSSHRKPPGLMNMPFQQQDFSSRGQAASFQMNLEVEEKRRAENAQNINVDLIQQKAQAQQEMMKSWSQREREVAAYKEKRQQAKALAKLERQTRKERDIVSSAIDAVIAEMSNKPLASFMDEDDEELAPIPPPEETPQPALKVNAFSMMMQAPTKKVKRRDAPIDFSHYLPNFEKSLESTDCHAVGEKEWAKVVAKNIAACVQADIIAFVHEWCHLQTRINAMNALLEIATAVAYTPGAVAERIRAGNTPNYLTVSMFITANKFSEPEAKRMMKDQWFVETLKQLRTDPVVPWMGDTWNGLDDVLRVLNDSGPVDFRRVFKTIKDALQEGSKSASLPIIKAIRREISDYVTHDSCFETKYNALNVLTDVAIGLLQGTLTYPRRDANLVIEALFEALLKIGQTLKVHEIEQVVEELQMDEGIPDARFCNVLDQLLIPDITQPLFTQQFVHCLSQRELVERLLKERSTRKTSEYCDTSLLMKLYHINWKTVIPDNDWVSSKGKLRIVLESLVDTSSSIEAEEYLEKINKNFAYELAGNPQHDGFGTLRESVDRTIHQISKRASSKASYESRTNAFKILTKIGLQLIGWLDPTKPYWQTTIFKDEVTEDSLTDAMRMVCHSLVKDDRARLLSDAELMKDLADLNTQRLQLSEAMLGLDLTMDLINGMDDDSKRAAISGTKRKVADYDEEPPQKKHAVARAPKKVVMMIDLTDD